MMRIERESGGAKLKNNFKTSKHGEVSYKMSDKIKVTKGILGFNKYRNYVIVKKEEDQPFMWLQSVENPDLAFVIVDPLIFFPNYMIIPEKSDLDELKVSDAKELEIYVIVNFPSENPQLSSANLIAPLVVNPKLDLGKQIVLPKSPYTSKHYIFDALKKKDLQKSESQKPKE
jgi:flagellar assembly factor FliW